MPSQQYQKLFCPVCKDYLGGRYYDQKIEAHCSECHAIFTFLPYIKKPIAVLDRDKQLKCGCGRCGR